MSNAATEALSVVVEREIPYPPEKIWRALTQPHLIEEWLMKNRASSLSWATVSIFAQTLSSLNWNGVVDCQVPWPSSRTKTLSYTWGFLGLEECRHLDLSPRRAGGPTCAWSIRASRSDQQQNYRGAQYGWQKFLAALEQVLARTD